MASGGARARSGPAPDPNALRRDRKDDAGWSSLPVARDGDVPEFPLPDVSGRELMLWESYWRKPQAILWERNGQQLEVALHVRTFCEAEKPDAAASLRTLVRQQLGELLLTIPALTAARYRIEAVEAPAVSTVVELGDRKSARDRLKALNSGVK